MANVGDGVRPLGFIYPHIGRLNQKYNSGHKGVDVGYAMRTPIRAIRPGGIMNNWTINQSGKINYIYSITYPDIKLRLEYYHCDPPFINNTGHKPKSGDIIGHTGNSGNSSGPHVHIQLAENASISTTGTITGGAYVDPEKYLWNELFEKPEPIVIPPTPDYKTLYEQTLAQNRVLTATVEQLNIEILNLKARIEELETPSVEPPIEPPTETPEYPYPPLPPTEPWPPKPTIGDVLVNTIRAIINFIFNLFRR